MTRNQWSPPQTASHTSISAPVKFYCPQACLALFQSSRLIRAKITSDQPDKYLLTMWYCTRSPSWENAFGDTSKSSQGVVNSDVSVPGGSEVLKLWLSACQSPQPMLEEVLLIAYKWCSCIWNVAWEFANPVTSPLQIPCTKKPYVGTSRRNKSLCILQEHSKFEVENSWYVMWIAISMIANQWF